MVKKKTNLYDFLKEIKDNRLITDKQIRDTKFVLRKILLEEEDEKKGVEKRYKRER